MLLDNNQSTIEYNKLATPFTKYKSEVKSTYQVYQNEWQQVWYLLKTGLFLDCLLH